MKITKNTVTKTKAIFPVLIPKPGGTLSEGVFFQNVKNINKHIF